MRILQRIEYDFEKLLLDKLPLLLAAVACKEPSHKNNKRRLFF